MRAFPVPIQNDDEERIMGGMLTFRQTLYIFIGIALGGASFFLTFLPILIRLFIYLVILIASLVLAFVKVNDMRADHYLILYLRWLCRQKKYHLRGNND